MTKNSNYIDWLSQHMSPDSLQKYLDYYTCIGDFCTERGILTRPLLDTTNQGAINDVLITIKHNKVFQSLYSKSAKEMWDAVAIYSDFLTEHRIHLADEIQNASEIDPHQFKFWSQLYIEVCSSLLEYDPDSFAYLKGGSLFSGDRPEFGTASAAPKMTHPVEIGKDYYIETSFDNSVIVKRIIELFEFCAVDDPDILFPGILSSLNIPPEENNSIQAGSDDQLDNPSDWIRDECDPNRESEYEDAELEEELMSEDNSSHYSDAPYVFSSIPTLDKETEGIPAEPQDSVFDQPISFSFFGSQYHVSSWSGLYVQICKLLHEDYPVAFENLEGCALLSGGQIEFGDETDSYQMKYPEEIALDFYVETDFSDEEIRHRVDLLLYYCDISLKHLQIVFDDHRTNSTYNLPIDKLPTQVTKPEVNHQEAFQTWLKKQPKKNSALPKTFAECSEYARNKGLITVDFWEMDDITILKTVYAQLITALYSSGFTAGKRNRYKNVLGMYIQWLETE